MTPEQHRVDVFKGIDRDLHWVVHIIWSLLADGVIDGKTSLSLRSSLIPGGEAKKGLDF